MACLDLSAMRPTKKLRTFPEDPLGGRMTPTRYIDGRRSVAYLPKWMRLSSPVEGTAKDQAARLNSLASCEGSKTYGYRRISSHAWLKILHTPITAGLS